MSEMMGIADEAGGVSAGDRFELLEAAAGWRRLMAEGKYPALCNPLNPGGITREWDKRQWLRAMQKARQLKGPKLP